MCCVSGGRGDAQPPPLVSCRPSSCSAASPPAPASSAGSSGPPLTGTAAPSAGAHSSSASSPSLRGASAPSLAPAPAPLPTHRHTTLYLEQYSLLSVMHTFIIYRTTVMFDFLISLRRI